MPAKGVLLIILTTCSVILNSAVLTSLYRKRNVIPPYMFLVMNLAVSDLFLALLGCTLRGPGLVVSNENPTSTIRTVCKVTMFLYHPVIVSINNMVLLLTFDRFLAITRPLKHKIVSSCRFVKRAVVVSWLISCLLIVINLIGVYLQAPEVDWYDPHFQRCSLTTTFTGQIVHIFNYFFFLVVPSTLSVFFYAKIVITVRRRRSLIVSNRHCNGPNSCSRPTRAVSTKSFLTISIILLLYYISYLPSLILRDIPAGIDVICSRYFNFNSYEFPSAVTSATSIAFYISTFTDPIVYGIRSPYIFKGLKKGDLLRRLAEKTSTAGVNGLADVSNHDMLKLSVVRRSPQPLYIPAKKS